MTALQIGITGDTLELTNIGNSITLLFKAIFPRKYQEMKNIYAAYKSQRQLLKELEEKTLCGRTISRIQQYYESTKRL